MEKKGRERQGGGGEKKKEEKDEKEEEEMNKKEGKGHDCSSIRWNRKFIADRNESMCRIRNI